MKRPILSVILVLLAALISPDRFAEAADTLTIPAGSTLHVRLATSLSTRTNQNGDPFSGQILEPIFANGEEVVPAGSTLEGHVTYVKEPGRATGVAQMRLVADSVTTPDEVKFSLTAGLEDAQGAPGAKVSGEEGTVRGPGKSKKGTAAETGVDAGIGAGVGAITGGGTGSLYGAGIGAVIGMIHNLGKRHKDIILPQGTELTFVVARNTTAKKVVNPADTSTHR